VIAAIRRFVPGLFYGWVVVAAAVLVVALSAGVRFSFGVAVPAMQRRWTLEALSLAVVVNSVVVGAAQPFVGRLVDRVGARAVLAGGLALIGLATLGMASAREVWQLWVTYGVLGGLGFAATLQLAASVLAARWFVARRGLVVGLVQSGGSIASFLVLPIATYLIERIGWPDFYRVTGLALLVVIPATWALIRNSPEDLGLIADGRAHRPVSQPVPPADAGPRPRVTAALGSATFYRLTFGLFV
jgi:MFS family permease